jgi:hypothetical protein
MNLLQYCCVNLLGYFDFDLLLHVGVVEKLSLLKICADICQKYPGGTPIEKLNFPFSIFKSNKSIVNTAMVIQFHLKLAFASTDHKIQGATIPKPQKSNNQCHWHIALTAAMVYVMLSQVCSLEPKFESIRRTEAAWFDLPE